MRSLRELELPNLRTIERDLGIITDNAQLDLVRLSALRSIGGAVRICRITLLATVDLGATQLGRLEVHDNLELAELGAPSLQTILPGVLVGPFTNAGFPPAPPSCPTAHRGSAPERL